MSKTVIVYLHCDYECGLPLDHAPSAYCWTPDGTHQGGDSFQHQLQAAKRSNGWERFRADGMTFDVCDGCIKDIRARGLNLRQEVLRHYLETHTRGTEDDS